MGSNRHRRRVEPTEDWKQIELLCAWPEQRDYELIRPSVLFGSPASGRAKETGQLRSVGRPRLFGTSAAVPQPRLFGLDALGETGWLKALRLKGYAPTPPRRPHALQQTLFSYAEAL